MLAVARRITRDEEDAADAVQDAFLNAFRSIDTFEERSSLGTWLHRIVVNSALMKIRTQQRRPEISIEELLPDYDSDGLRLEPETELVSIETLLEQGETREFVRSAINKLPDNYRNLLLLRDIEEYNTRETAELLEITPGAVKTGLHRARAALKSLLDPIMCGENSEVRP
jgi:RNA polymerase sigma-70 factor (ECF subfamily)